MEPQRADATIPRRFPVQGGTTSPLALVLVPGFSGAHWDAGAQVRIGGATDGSWAY